MHGIEVLSIVHDRYYKRDSSAKCPNKYVGQELYTLVRMSGVRHGSFLYFNESM